MNLTKYIDLKTEEGARQAREVINEFKRLAKLLKCEPLEVSGKVWILLENIERLAKLLNECGGMVK